MGFSELGLLLLILQLLVGGVFAHDTHFDENYQVLWGFDHFSTSYRGREVQLSMDKTSGSGFVSKLSYGSGFFHMRIKVPGRDSAGVITTFYLISVNEIHDELDFEFLGNVEDKPITLQTNVFANGYGNREQRISLWFDPRVEYHDYKILWNHHQIVFYVDDIPIRVFKNNKKYRLPYPSNPMKIEATLWQADWATDGGRTKTNWSYAPFKAHYQGFDVSGCTPQQNSIKECYGHHFWWNSRKFWELDPYERQAYENVRKRFLNYDYCTDSERKPIADPLECRLNS